MAYLLAYFLALLAAASARELQGGKIFDEDTKRGIVCFCNQAECVADGYFCKSRGLGCYSDLLDEEDFSKSQHGCIDLLPRERERSCQNVPGSSRGLKGSLLLCCHQDMCNHIDSPETRNKFNESIRALQSLERLGGVVEEGERLELAEQDAAWFKAATVAVPICGALILLILIVLALKLLKTDPQPLQPKLRVGASSRDISTNNPHTDTGLKKLPLLYQHNDCGSRVGQEKNEANAKLNCPSNLLDLSKSSQRAPCNLYQPLIPPVPVHNDENLYNKAFLIDWGSTIPHS